MKMLSTLLEKTIEVCQLISKIRTNTLRVARILIHQNCVRLRVEDVFPKTSVLVARLVNAYSLQKKKTLQDSRTLSIQVEFRLVGFAQ